MEVWELTSSTGQWSQFTVCDWKFAPLLRSTSGDCDHRTVVEALFLAQLISTETQNQPKVHRIACDCVVFESPFSSEFQPTRPFLFRCAQLPEHWTQLPLVSGHWLCRRHWSGKWATARKRKIGDCLKVLSTLRSACQSFSSLRTKPTTDKNINRSWLTVGQETVATFSWIIDCGCFSDGPKVFERSSRQIVGTLLRRPDQACLSAVSAELFRCPFIWFSNFALKGQRRSLSIGFLCQPSQWALQTILQEFPSGFSDTYRRHRRYISIRHTEEARQYCFPQCKKVARKGMGTCAIPITQPIRLLEFCRPAVSRSSGAVRVGSLLFMLRD